MDWLDHLSGSDLELLRSVASRTGSAVPVVRDDDALTRLLADPAMFDAVFATAGDEPLLAASPFLTFALIVHRGWADLQHATYVDEWVGPRERLPVLGGDDLRDFFGASARRLFLAELLASYTRVASGSTYVRTPRGWRRRRFSELDPLRLASLLDAVPEAERAGVYRRLGDLALFLTGVFPDRTDGALGGIQAARLLHFSGIDPGGADDLPGDGGVALLERLGARWYRTAVRTTPRPLSDTVRPIAEIAERFQLARRSLNYLTDRFLFARRAGWFGQPA
jgi:hypothetical protein